MAGGGHSSIMSPEEKDRPLSPTQQRAEAARKAKRDAFEAQVRDGTLVVREMTPEERERHLAQREERRGRTSKGGR